MNTSYKILLYSHIAVGFVALVLFWIPVLTKKGSALHSRTGHWYAKAMYAVGYSALVLSIMLILDPIAFKFGNVDMNPEKVAKLTAQFNDVGLFLLSISLLTIVGVHHGLQSIQAKGNHAQMRSFANIGSNISLLAVGALLGFTATGSSPMSVLFYIFAGLSIVNAIGNLRFCLKQNVTRAEQIIAHLSAIIGAGIGAHTAFFLFGASRLLAGVFTGYLSLIPWTLPGIVGTLIIIKQSKKYKPKKKKTNKTKQTAIEAA